MRPLRSKNERRKRLRRLGGLLVMLATTAAACQNGGDGNKAPEQKEVRLAYVNWAEGVAMTQLARTILTDKMGYKVKLVMADVAPVYSSVATGDSDAFLDAWLPVTHKAYMEKFGDKLVKLGVSYTDARIGLVVPSYVPLTSIPQLKEQPDRLNRQIIGIDSGAGIMRATDRALSKYQLPLKLVPSSGPAMTAALKDAIANDEWIVITGWKPHWMFARWSLKFLADPENAYGRAENIYTVARRGLKEDLPQVAQFFERFGFTDEQLSSLIYVFQEQGQDDPQGAARAWIRDHSDLVAGWIPDGAVKPALPPPLAPPSLQ